MHHRIEKAFQLNETLIVIPNGIDGIEKIKNIFFVHNKLGSSNLLCIIKPSMAI